MSYRKNRQAFTLVELLVVIGILAVLIAILLPSLAKAKDSAKRTVCATNLKGQASALGTYATANGDNLPRFTNTAGNWLHDEPLEFGDTLTSVPLGTTGTSTMKRWFYCPANEFQADAAPWTMFTGNRYRALGYNYLNWRGGGGYPALGPGGKLQRYTKAMPDISYARKWNPSFAANTEVAFDFIYVSTNRGTDYSTAGPHGGLVDVATSHLRGKSPQGQNILFLDGHVEWKPWPGNMKATCIPNSGGSSFIYLTDP